MKPALLVTGAGGFLGRSVLPALEEHWRVLRLVSPRSALDGPDVFQADLADEDDTLRLAGELAGREYHALLHLAFCLPRGGDERDATLLTRNNSLTWNVAALAQALSPRCLVNMSSLAVYPARSGVYDERSAVDPSANTQCLYGLAKFNAEMLLNHLAPQGTSVVNLRLTQAYGPGTPPNLLPGRMKAELAETGCITVLGLGQRVSNFIHTADVALALRAVLASPAPGTYNLACRTNLSYLEVARRIAAAQGAPPACVRLLEKGNREQCPISSEKFAQTFGLQLTTIDFRI